MKILKRVRGKIIRRESGGITVRISGKPRKEPVFVPVSEMSRPDVSVIIWENGGEDGFAIGATVDVMWWDEEVDYTELLGGLNRESKSIDPDWL